MNETQNNSVPEVSPYTHLTQDAIRLLRLPPKERVRAMGRDTFVHYPAVDEAFANADFLVNSMRVNRASGLLICGDSGQGKSSIALALVRRYGPMPPTSLQAARLPAIYIDLTYVTDARQIFVLLLEAMGHPHPHRLTHEERKATFVKQVEITGTVLIIMDEIQDVMVTTTRQAELCLQAIRLVMNKTRCPVILMGNQRAQAALNHDPHLAARFETIALARWTAGPQLARVLEAIGRTLPLHKPSNLSSREIMRWLIRVTDGNLKEIKKRLTRAAMLAAEDGTECITLSILERGQKEWPQSLMGVDPSAEGAP